MRTSTPLVVAVGWLAACDALQIGSAAGRSVLPQRAAHRQPMLQHCTPRSTFPATIRMQLPDLDASSQSFYDGYVQTDPVTGESKALSLDEKEKLYLECLDAYYNEGGKQLLGDEEYEQLKLDLDFDGSKIATFSKDEIKFVLANKRFGMGKPILDDEEYNALREKLRAAGSTVVIHQGAKCDVDTGICKSDLLVDAAKTRLLYLPGTIGGSLLLSEIMFWTIHIDPILSIVLGAIPAYFFGVWFTENIFAQKPLVVQGSCPDCGALNNVFFGDLFNVMTDGIAGGVSEPPSDVVKCKCINCKIDLEADRSKMIFTGMPKNVA